MNLIGGSMNVKFSNFKNKLFLSKGDLPYLTLNYRGSLFCLIPTPGRTGRRSGYLISSILLAFHTSKAEELHSFFLILLLPSNVNVIGEWVFDLIEYLWHTKFPCACWEHHSQVSGRGKAQDCRTESCWDCCGHCWSKDGIWIFLGI